MSEEERLGRLLHLAAMEHMMANWPQRKWPFWDDLYPCNKDRYLFVAAEVLKTYTRKEKPCPTPNSNA